MAIVYTFGEKKMMQFCYCKPGSDKKTGKAKVVVVLYFILLFIFLCIFPGKGTQVYGAVPQKEREALIALYKSTNGDGWSNKNGWKTPPLHSDGFAVPGTERGWHGVYCDRLNTMIVAIELRDNNLGGTIPVELGNLSNLSYLDFYDNYLSGSIPPELGNLSHLSYLNLYDNRLTGSIPPELGSLSHLTYLDFYNNNLTGSIPPELGSLSNLSYLNLYDNNLTGSIPPELGNLSNLSYLNLYYNRLTGSIPPELGSLSNLSYLNIYNNYLTGSIPPELGNLSNLEELYLYYNQLSGSIPPELGSLSNLEKLYLSGNQLTGSIPPELGNLSKLEYLSLSSNQLSGPIPPELGNLLNLETLSLSSNQLSGPIPPELGNLSNLEGLYLYYNDLTGSIPPELGNLSNLKKFNLYTNQLSGPIPPELGSLLNLEEIDLSYNQLTGIIPPELGKLSNLEEIDLSYNQLTGIIPPELGNLSNLGILYLYSNQISGPIPTELGALKSLFWLNLSSNQLSGPIPPEFGYLSNLGSLKLDNNQLAGGIPVELGNLRRLEYLYLSSNQLSGSIPPELGNLIDLDYLDLYNNQLSGSIPQEFGNIGGLDYINLASNHLSGSIPPELGNLASLNSLYLYDNQLSGSIPPELGNIDELYSLNVASNQLSGTIPPMLKTLSTLTDNRCDFRWNALYTDDKTVMAFLEEKQIGGKWENTQTTAPQGVTARAVSGTSIEVSWTPIAYISDEGGYRLFYSQTAGGPYILYGSTGTKYNSRIEFQGVEPFTPYYFVVQTRTEPHRYNKSPVESLFSKEVSASTGGSDKIISGRVVTDPGIGAAGITMIFSPSTRSGITDAGGYYRYAVEPGWSGTVEPSGTGYTFKPAKIELNNVTTHQRGINFKANPIVMSISGNVLSGDEGIENVTLTFASYSGETGTEITGPGGQYTHPVPYGWTGRVTPSKGNLIFYPSYKEYGEPGVTGDMEHQGYQLSVSITLNVSREEDNTFLIKAGYGNIELNASIIGISADTVQAFVIYRKEGGGAYKPIKEFPRQEPYQFTYVDKYLHKGKTYTYIGTAVDAKGNIIGESKEKSI